MSPAPPRPLQPFDQRIRIWGLRGLALLAAPLVLFTRPAWAADGWAVETMETLGIYLVVAAVVGRFWAILYIGGRKNREVVRDGPYSVCRHPLYLFSTLGVVGFGLMLGSLTLALALGGAVGLALWATAGREEAWLRQDLGPAYAAYAAEVPRLWPRPSLFRTPPRITVAMGALRTNFADALVFLALLPLAELLEGAKASGWLPLGLSLP